MLKNRQVVLRTILPAFVALVALVPLFGDPQITPVTHTEWARMLVRALEIEDGLPPRAPASFVFQALSWKSSLYWNADQYSAFEGVVSTEARAHAVATAENPGEVRYRVAIIRSGDYNVRVRARSEAQTPLEVEISAPDAPKPLYSRTVTPAVLSTWKEGGTTHLDRGLYSLVLALPPATVLERVEIVPPCLNPIEPPGGWQALFVAQTGDVAATALQALDWENELPPADMPRELTGADFMARSGALLPASAGAALTPESYELKGGRSGLRATVLIDVPVDGLYTLSYFGEQGQGLRFVSDACFKSVLCPPDVPTGMQWFEIMTGRLTAGRHALTAALTPGAAIQRLRIERKKDGPEDYEAALRRLGFDVGTPGPITRARAIDCMNFIREQRRRMAGLDRLCGDQIDESIQEGSRIAEAGGPLDIPGMNLGGPQTGLPPAASGDGQPPIELPIVPQAPGSPVLP